MKRGVKISELGRCGESDAVDVWIDRVSLAAASMLIVTEGPVALTFDNSQPTRPSVVQSRQRTENKPFEPHVLDRYLEKYEEETNYYSVEQASNKFVQQQLPETSSSES